MLIYSFLRYSDSLRMEIAPFGVKVITVKPGGVKSDIGITQAKGLSGYVPPSLFLLPSLPLLSILMFSLSRYPSHASQVFVRGNALHSYHWKPERKNNHVASWCYANRRVFKIRCSTGPDRKANPNCHPRYQFIYPKAGCFGIPHLAFWLAVLTQVWIAQAEKHRREQKNLTKQVLPPLPRNTLPTINCVN